MAAVAGTVSVGLLGPLHLAIDGEAVDVRGPKRRAVLAMLALAQGRAVTVDALVDALWPQDPPESGRAALHSHISRLRGHLGPCSMRLETLDGAYRLTLDQTDLDAARARALLGEARAARTGEPAVAAALAREARELWRGPILADLVDVAPLAAAAVGLAELGDQVAELLISAAIDAGQAEDVVHLATAGAAADPLREAAALLMIRALAATGRAPDALRTAREFRHRLVDETGLDPSAALGELERAIAGGAIGRVNAVGASAPRRPAPRVAPGTRLVGRDAEVAALTRLLAAERLVTLVGPGGVGKTRLALEIARRTPEAAVLFLAPITDPGAVPHALADALDLKVASGDVVAACVSLLAAGPSLLVIDNCEHQLDTVREVVAALVSGCPELTVLATSRDLLGSVTESPFRLAPLALPPAGGRRAISDVASVAVFLERAVRARPAFSPDAGDLDVIADIVRRLDGMPLAIELAAGRLSTFSLTDLHSRLDRALDLFGGPRLATDARHRTLRATVEWSYTLLPAPEQQLFRHLAVFVDGVDLTTAERVAGELDLPGDPGSALAHLVDASMLNVSFDAGTRYRMLETLRAFGLDRLDAAGERAGADDRLLDWALELTAWIDATVTTESEPDADAALRRELPNLRTAWRLARGRADLDAAVALATALQEPSAWRDLTELWGWAAELVEDPSLRGHPRAAHVLGTAAMDAYMRGDYPGADRLARNGLAVAADADAEGRQCCLTALGSADLSRGAWTEVIEHNVAAAALGGPARESLGTAALAAAYAGDLARARELSAEMTAVASSPSLRAYAAYVAGEIENAAGTYDNAQERYLHAIELARSAGATFIVGIASVGLLSVQAAAGRVGDALAGYREVIEYWAHAGNWTHLWVTLRNLAVLLRRLGDEAGAALIADAAAAAPDAPVDASVLRERRQEPVADRVRVLEVALLAIEDQLTRGTGASTKDSSRTHSV